jgi:hypothetical protein
MEYCLGDADGSATMWTADPNTDVDGDGALDAVGLDFDGDGVLDDAMADMDGDGLADHAARIPQWRRPSGSVLHRRRQRHVGGQRRPGRNFRWFGLDGLEHTGGPVVDLDGDGQSDDRLTDTDGNGLADRALSGDAAYVDSDGDGHWDIKLADSDGDGKADAATEL